MQNPKKTATDHEMKKPHESQDQYLVRVAYTEKLNITCGTLCQ